MSEAVILEAVRSPFGRRGGVLREQRPDSLLAQVIDGLVERAGIAPEKIEDVIDGTVTLAGEQGANPGRLAVLLSNLPDTVSGVALNRMCGSSQQAVHFAAQAVASGDMDYVIGCGVESMSRVPMFLDIGLGKEVSGFETLNPELFKRAEAVSVFRRLGTAQEVANSAVFLASPAASNITAANLRVDGGAIKTVNF